MNLLNKFGAFLTIKPRNKIEKNIRFPQYFILQVIYPSNISPFDVFALKLIETKFSPYLINLVDLYYILFTQRRPNKDPYVRRESALEKLIHCRDPCRLDLKSNSTKTSKSKNSRLYRNVCAKKIRILNNKYKLYYIMISNFVVLPSIMSCQIRQISNKMDKSQIKSL